MNNRPTQDEYGMSFARAAAARSKDPSTKCGCVIFDVAGRVVSSGYNGFPRYVDDDERMLQDREIKLALTIHAEANAIFFAQRDLNGCTAYVWPMPPCAGCAAKLAQVGITRIVTMRPTDEQADRWGKFFALAEWVYEQAGITYDEVIECHSD